ncbi:stAR-related lipid transfer protein 8 isoform X1 [Phalacrocorax carbo]|uniref:stAR-related lipid transfer protein 8 isoform X1 n=2 Tax=Phalacrocorax carbo TaxID=9209 RepID=UPI0031196BD9
METRSAEHRAKPPVSQGQQGELLPWCSSAGEEGEEGVYCLFCRSSSERSPEDEPNYALTDDDSSPCLGGSFPRRTWRHCPRSISLTEDRAGHRGDGTSKNKFFRSGEVLAFDELSQTKHRHVLEHGEAELAWLLEPLWADLGQHHDIPDREEDEDNAFSPSPGEMKTWSGQLCFTLLEDKKDAETEAKKACDWLRAAGFPQYAQLYEDSSFPLDISAVKKDHSFLDQDSLKSLCRRLMTLNTCASMKLEVHFQRKQNEDSEEEDLCAISDRWAFQRDSKRWSRVGSVDVLSQGSEVLSSTTRPASSRESVLTDLSTNPEAVSLHSSGSTGCTLGVGAAPPEPPSPICTIAASSRSLSERSLPEQPSSRGEGSKEKPKKLRSRSFLKRIESLRRKDREKAGPEEKVAPHDSIPATPGWDSLKSNRDVAAAKASSPKRGISASFHGKKHFFSLSYRTNRLLGSGGSKVSSDPKRSRVYLEDYETPVTASSKWAAGDRQHRQACEGNCLVYIPLDHKPGTFPKSLSIESLCPLAGSSLTHWKSGNAPAGLVGGGSSSSVEGSSSPPGFACRRRRGSCSSLGSRVSIYDNVPEFGSSEDFCKEDGEVTYENLDDILQHMWGLQQKVELWYKAISPNLAGEEGGEEEEEEEEESDSGGEPSNLHFEERSMSDVGTSASDFDSTGNSLNEAEEIEMRERRDSGVGASLTRPCRKLRWHSFQNSHRPSLNSASLEINRQSSAQLNLLQKCSLLRLTAIMEKYSVPHKQAWTWTVPKFMKRSKVPDYRDKMVFGVPPIINVQRTGQPLPQSIQQAMRYIRSQCLDQVGIFRKSGVKSRIQALRHMNETSPDNVNYDGQSAYDVADLLKQYFRDLPEPIFTSKLTDTFLQIYQFVSKEQQLQAVQAAVILMPDENREVLQTLLYFLSDIASAEENQMTAGNLAVCLAPSIFHLNVSKKESTSPRVIHKRGTMGKPDQKDLNENMAATQGLSHMITDCKKLFQVSHDILLQLSNSYMAADAYPHRLSDFVCQGESKDLHSYFEQSVQNLLKESLEKFKGWLNTPGPLNTELSCKKVGDGHPLRLWKVSTEVEAPPTTVLHRVLRERHLWDEDLLQSKVVEALDKNMEVYHYVTDSMAPHPRRDCVVLRRWCTDLPRGACLLISLSVEHDKLPAEGGVKAVVLTSQYLIEPSAVGRSKVTHICRADLRGRSPEWYNKVFGHLCAMELARIRDSFPALSPTSPETKI